MSQTGDRTRESKECPVCEGLFFKRSKLSRAQWNEVVCCSVRCQRLQARRACIEKGRWKVWAGDRKIYRARAVMEAHLGRQLLDEEVVHHINGNKLDDRIENLQLFNSQAEHMREE